MFIKLLLVVLVLSIFGVVSKGAGFLAGAIILYSALKSLDIEY